MHSIKYNKVYILNFNISFIAHCTVQPGGRITKVDLRVRSVSLRSSIFS